MRPWVSYPCGRGITPRPVSPRKTRKMTKKERLELEVELIESIQTLPVDSTPQRDLVQVLERLRRWLAVTNERLDDVEETAANANRIAGCLANGIKPD